MTTTILTTDNTNLLTDSMIFKKKRQRHSNLKGNGNTSKGADSEDADEIVVPSVNKAPSKVSKSIAPSHPGGSISARGRKQIINSLHNKKDDESLKTLYALTYILRSACHISTIDWNKDDFADLYVQSKNKVKGLTPMDTISTLVSDDDIIQRYFNLWINEVIRTAKNKMDEMIASDLS